jgi:hypothetical protein
MEVVMAHEEVSKTENLITSTDFLSNFDFEIPDEDLPAEDEEQRFELLDPSSIPIFSDYTPHTTKQANPNPWDPRMVVDLALAVDALPDILLRYNLSKTEFENLASNPIFRRDLAVTTREVRENGLQFQRKARVQADIYLETLDNLVHSEATPAGVRLDAIKSVVRWGDLEPKDDKKDEAGSANNINIQINF